MERVRMGLVGLNFGRYIIENQLLDGPGKEFIELRAVCDMDREKVTAAGEKYGVAAYASLEELLADPTIEAVGLFTGPNGRAGLLRKILAAGKAVMTTKPFELDPEAARSVLAQARERNLALHLNSPAPLPAADTAQILAWQKEYDLGAPVGVRWETYAGYQEKADGSWYDDPARCPVAPIFRLGIYGINELLTLLGPVAGVQVCHARLFTGRPTPDNAELSLLFRNGAIGSVFASFCVADGRPYPNQLCLHFQRGTITRNGALTDVLGAAPDAAALFLQTVDAAGKSVTQTARIAAPERAGAYQWRQFRQAVREGAAALAGTIDPELIVNGVEVIGAMARAESTGRLERIGG